MDGDIWAGANPVQEEGRPLKDTHPCQGAKNEGHPEALRCRPGCLQSRLHHEVDM